ncbi:MAG: right-handed parallel beta-helix repeat-containing protein [Candidatus Cloacimonetes bacterium]|nr:right-handed parallel beta-helix repeat-containing protein [Candidatus Cloacimonadota bacterium]
MLKIEPGVVVQFKSSQYTGIYDKPLFDFDFDNLEIGMLLIRGRLFAEGTTEDSILFTRSGNSGKWGILLFKDSENNILRNCIIEHSNYISNFEDNNYMGALSFHNSSANITENSFRDNDYDGIESWASDDVIIKFNEFSRNRRGVYCKAGSCKIENNYFLHNSKGVHCYDHSSPEIIFNIFESVGIGVICFNYSDPYISNCTFKCCSYGIYLERSNPDIIGNLIINNTSDGIDCVDDSCNPKIINNTIVNNNFYGIGRSLRANPDIINNLFWGNGYSSIEFFENHTNPIVSYSLIPESNLPSESDGGNNIFAQNPLFVNPDTDDFQLLENSPCINHGFVSSSLSLPALDILGNNRISGSSIDIGCIEYQE